MRIPSRLADTHTHTHLSAHLAVKGLNSIANEECFHKSPSAANDSESTTQSVLPLSYVCGGKKGDMQERAVTKQKEEKTRGEK